MSAVTVPSEREDSSATGDGREITVRYFATLREEAGTEEELVLTSAATVADLYGELTERHSLSLPAGSLRVAVNHRVEDWEVTIGEGDVVAFLPPFSGG